MATREDSDNLAWDRSDELWEEALRQVRLPSQCRKIESFAERISGKPATLVSPLIIGGFNVLYPIRLEGSSAPVLVRVPCPDQAVFPEEKTVAEAATATFIAQKTQVPVPKIFHHGIDSEIGPFMIIEDLGTRRGMGQALEAPREDLNETAVLDPNISETKLKTLYVKMARSDAWYVALAEMQIATLLFQHNDMVSSEDDCRNKYVARQLFRRLAKQGRLGTFGFAEDDWSTQSQHARATLPMPDGSGSFRLWADDFRPANVLVDGNDEIIGAIDWEFAYVGPTQLVLDAPWWLLLDAPEMWDNGIEDWASVYERRLETWISAMQQAEQDVGPSSLLLSAYMRESWETGRFWLDYAARKSWAFDTIYWKYLDERFFGERERDFPKKDLWRGRVHLLSEDERAAMEPLVQTKMQESQERVLVEWDAEDARRRLSSFLFD
ncbi:hypothetical protein SLS63_007067 [Diaporthe eres]|uniref:Aminoglycoside phosphotransferase domain-containing protein n=1 Tax=Diaporthe eres TaxID=83184 RepID=A0ABR1P6M5_DIAER